MWEAGSIQCNCISPRSVFLTILPAACSKWTGTLGSEVSIELNIDKSWCVILVFVCDGTRGQPLCWLVYRLSHSCGGVSDTPTPTVFLLNFTYFSPCVKLVFISACTFSHSPEGIHDFIAVHERSQWKLILSVISTYSYLVCTAELFWLFFIAFASYVKFDMP